ncbi:hypothetical protein SETIT_7G013400v2 [Setaria italica]|uniref:Uncharacterized protein n=1 Tax=Setaria italica TaxID=4555 RepID=A0A368RR27_SETIT|nr:hypothetical protein SETIT_7G013400v2 [Setaria italica]
MDKLSYTRMVTKEGMMLHTVFPLLLPHLCRETCEVGGFKVAKGSKVIINAWAKARSPEYWQDLEKLKPESLPNGMRPDQLHMDMVGLLGTHWGDQPALALGDT